MSRVKALLDDPNLSEEERQLVQNIVNRVEEIMQKHQDKVRIMKQERNASSLWSKIKRLS